MKFNVMLVLFFALSGCVINQLHFAAYSTDAELSSIKSKITHSTITREKKERKREKREKGDRFIFPTLISIPGGERI
ncbi:hypothetical protein [Pseudomonas sp. F16(2018)]|uniref:hypothetical protein n=1 Tax=Pseudomonas sp. F16(2018) TaxID=2093746 RepID=UPI00111BCCA5|nr:hypothetical protein [Pseudomonas sp. F16(2018)]